MSFSKQVKPKVKANQETELLIESMQKLIDHMNENQTHQEEIFKSLTNNDVIKIIQNFDDPSQIMRKTSAAFLCELVYDNEKVQQSFCDITKILQAEGKVCVTKIPQNFLAHSKALPEIFDTIKNTPPPSDYPLGWYYEIPADKNYKKGLKYLKFERNQQGKSVKQRVQQFIDPQNCLFGFFVKPLKNTEIKEFKSNLVMDKQFQSEQFQDPVPLPTPKLQTSSQPQSKYTTQQASSSQSPQHHIPQRYTYIRNLRKPISALNNSMDLGASTLSSTREQIDKNQRAFNKTFAEGDQFVIKEEQTPSNHQPSRYLGHSSKVLRDKIQGKRSVKVGPTK